MGSFIFRDVLKTSEEEKSKAIVEGGPLTVDEEIDSALR